MHVTRRLFASTATPFQAAAKLSTKEPKVLPELRQRSLLTSKLWVHRVEDRISKLTNQGRSAFHQLPSDASSGAKDGGVKLDTSLRKMADSFVQVFLPFRSDSQLKEEYMSPYGRIRIGKVLEDLDALAGSIAYLHCADAERELTIVTASVDRIDLMHEIPVDQDISIFGYVTFVGKSSMEVSIHMETILPDSGISAEDMDDKYMRSKLPQDKLSGESILDAKFIMVARDPSTGKAAKVPQLKLDTNQERKLFLQGTEHKARKQFACETALSIRPPSTEEMSLVHSLYLNYRQYEEKKGGENSVDSATPLIPKPAHIEWMRDTRLQNIHLTFPQDRNLHQKIFGGHLMRLAYELGYAVGTMFAQTPLKFMSLDDISFRRPVEIGAILDLSGQVVFTRDRDMVVKVVANVVEPVSNRRELSNEFWFTFKSVPKRDNCESLPRQIMPKSYNDCMLYLEGKRRFEN
ncbi:Acyl-coenzyme A thioesterase 9, mitochondrial [Chytriomyces hyalinus]|nr:Acyl-coenzyme A thioesterase 9, mitochondrial [Chytriomyces hyalinus]